MVWTNIGFIFCLMNLQQRLQGVFKQSFQIKRVQKEIENIGQAKVKMGLEVKYIITKPVQITIVISFTNNKLSSIPKLHFLNKLDFKIILKNTYPTEPPRLYFLFENVIQLGIHPYHNYMKLVYEDWGPKVTILDIIKRVPAFVVECKQKGHGLGKWEGRQYFEIDKMVGFQSCQNFPVRVIRLQHTENGMMVIVQNRQIIILQQINLQGAYITSDIIPIQQIYSIQKHKTKHLRALLQIKKQNVKQVLQFSSDECHTIIEAIVEAMKMCVSQQKEGVDQLESSSSDDEKLSMVQEGQLGIDEKNIDEIESQIVILQSIVDHSPNSNNIKQLVDVLKRVVEYYSIHSSPRFQIHLKTLQAIMGNPFMQTMMQSTDVLHSDNKHSAYETIAHYL